MKCEHIFAVDVAILPHTEFECKFFISISCCCTVGEHSRVSSTENDGVKSDKVFFFFFLGGGGGGGGGGWE